MGAYLGDFDANQIEPDAEFTPLPAGDYVAVVASSDMQHTQNGNGEMIVLELEIVEGEHKGRKLWDRMLLKHDSAQAVEIAKKKLSGLCRAVGVLKPQDTSELHNIPCLVKVQLKPRKDTGELSNEVKSYKPSGGAASQQTPPAQSGDVPPWQR